MPAPSIEQASRDWLTQWWADSNLTPTPTLIATERPARAACRYPLIVVRQLPGGREERCLGHLEPATITDLVAAGQLHRWRAWLVTRIGFGTTSGLGNLEARVGHLGLEITA